MKRYVGHWWIGLLVGVILVAIFYAVGSMVVLAQSKLGLHDARIRTYGLHDMVSMTTTQFLIKTMHQQGDYDLRSDASLQKYVGNGSEFYDILYAPGDLETIQSPFVVVDTTVPLLRAPARQGFLHLAKAFYEHFGLKLYLLSAYRSYEHQQYLLDQGCSARQCAEPGTSEHQAGLAVDIHVATKHEQRIRLYPGSKYYVRLQDNAHQFGYHNTFQKGTAIDGQMQEARHRRYIGVDFATFLYENNLTIGEFFAAHMDK